MDAAQIAIEEKKLELDERRVRVEEKTADQPLWPRLGVIIPLFVAAFALAGNFYSERNNRNARTQLAKDTFELKVADIVMDTRGPFGTKNRANAMRQLFPQRLGASFASGFDPEQASDRETFERDQLVASKKELLKLLAEHPDARTQILSTWRKLFPADEWANSLS